MPGKKELWVWRARRVDAHWKGGWSILGDDRMRDPDGFRRAVRRVAKPVLRSMLKDEATFRALRTGQAVEVDAIVRDVLDGVLPSMDPDDGVRFAVVKLQLAALEALDAKLRDDVLADHPDIIDREYTDEQGMVGFL